METLQKQHSKGRVYGYARVNSEGQDLTVQLDTLNSHGCIAVFTEKKSGAKRDGRTELQRLLAVAQPGDTIMITRIDRLARSMKDLQDIVHEMKTKGVALKATEQPIDTGSAAGKAFLDMLGVFAEFETNLRRERQMEGIAKAKVAGVYAKNKGRQPTLDAEKVLALRAQGVGPAKIAKQLRIARSSVYRILGQSEGACAITAGGAA